MVKSSMTGKSVQRLLFRLFTKHNETIRYNKSLEIDALQQRASQLWVSDIGQVVAEALLALSALSHFLVVGQASVLAGQATWYSLSRILTVTVFVWLTLVTPLCVDGRSWLLLCRGPFHSCL